MSLRKILEAMSWKQVSLGNLNQEVITDAHQQILALLPKKRVVQIGDSDMGTYITKGYVCIHGINLTRGNKLCIECANDKGFNQAISEITHRLEGV